MKSIVPDLFEKIMACMIKNKDGGSVPENGCKSRKIKSIVPDLFEKIMACMIKNKDILEEKTSCKLENFPFLQISLSSEL